MKNGYDKFFKQAKLAAEQNQRPQRFDLSKDKRADRKTDPRVGEGIPLAELLKKNPKKKPKRRPIQWKLAGLSILGIVLGLLGITYIDQVEHFVKKIEVGLFGLALAEEKAETPSPAKPATEPAKEEKPEEPKKASFTEEEINHFVKLNDRKRELDAREEELAREEAEFQAQKAELDKRLKDLEQTRRQISSVLEERVKADEAKIETLTQMYSTMKPAQAAKVFETMDEDLAVDIIGRMKKKNAAEIMNLIKPDKAQLFSEKFAGYKRQPSAEPKNNPTTNNPTKEGGND